MHPLEREVGSLEYLLAMPPEELAGKLLFLLRTSPSWFGGGNGINKEFDRRNLMISLYQMSQAVPYRGERQDEVKLAIQEALGWLQAQALIVDAGSGTHFVLSRRATYFEDERQFASFRLQRLLPREFLHPRLGEPVWLDFMRGDYPAAVGRAMREVEITISEVAERGPHVYGLALVGEAFHIDTGRLADPAEEKGERNATRNLYAGVIGKLKNPFSHRRVSLDEAADAAALIMFASYLLRDIEDRAHRLPSR